MSQPVDLASVAGQINGVGFGADEIKDFIEMIGGATHESDGDGDGDEEMPESSPKAIVECATLR